MSIRCWRAHGLGNDYLVLAAGPTLDPALARALCDRHLGVGADGVLEPIHSDRADHGVKIWNPDGSVAEKSGNGLRIYARWLTEHRNAPPRFTIDTGYDIVTCAVGEQEVTVAMGRATVAPEAVPVRRRLVDDLLDIGDESVRVVAVGVGNPHCVVFVDIDPEDTPWKRWGEALETHPAFPNRTNVQVAQVCGPGRVEIRIWERGAGPTLASGSSSCAVAAAAVLTGRLAPGPITVTMPGGSLGVVVSADLDVDLTGPVEIVGTIDVDERWLTARR